MSTCANCGQPLPEGTAFCPACGAPTQAPSRSSGTQSPGDEAATQVLPPGADQTPTQVLPPRGPAATQVMPAGMIPSSGTAPPAGSAVPPGAPPYATPPVGYGSPPPPGGASRKRLWIVIGAAVLGIIVVLVLLWALGVFGGGDDRFVGNWWALDDSGGLVIQSDLGVWIVNDDGSKAGPMQGTVDGDTLTFTLSESALRSIAGDDEQIVAALKDKVRFKAVFKDDSGHLFVTMEVTGDVGDLGSAFEPTTVEFKRVDVLPVTGSSPTPSVPPSQTPITSPTPTSTETPSLTPTPTVTPTGGGNAVDDQRVKNGAREIASAIDAYISDNGSAPASGTVTPGGAIDAYLPATSWPLNPYTDAPMTEGTGPGDYGYTATTDGTYTLTAHLGDGSDFTLP